MLVRLLVNGNENTRETSLHEGTILADSICLPGPVLKEIPIMQPPTRIINRESWLQNAVGKLTTLFESKGLVLPSNIVASCGWPGCGSISKRVGEVWPAVQSEGGKFEVFISPLLSEALGSGGVLATLCHELVHVSVGLDHGHKKLFKQAMAKLGLEGKATATTAGATLLAELEALALGKYPHATLNVKDRPQKKQTTRLLKLSCECGYIIRATRKHVEEKGAPICPTCRVSFEIEDNSVDN